MGLIRTPWTRQPQSLVGINKRLWPGRSQTLLPSLNGYVLGTGTWTTFTNPNSPFQNIKRLGRALGYRPNSSTSVGECFIWGSGNFDIGSNGSMIAIVDLNTTGYNSFAMYGGSNWGLLVGLKSDGVSVVARYVDSPTTSSYESSITVPTIPINTPYVIGAVKSGASISVFYGGQKATTSGGNGGIRRTEGSGLGAEISNNFGSVSLASVTESIIADVDMHYLVAHPWEIFEPLSRQIWVGPSAATGIPTLSAATAIDVTQTQATPQVALTF
jgi:hypothetical protein